MQFLSGRASKLIVPAPAQAVLKKALAYDGLARGLHEAARAIERDEAKVGPQHFSAPVTGPWLQRSTCHASIQDVRA